MRRIGSEHLQRRGIAGGEEPLPAAIDMPPALEMHALGVLPREHVGLELLVGGTGTVAFQMRLVAGGELGFLGGDAAVGAGQGQHGALARTETGRSRRFCGPYAMRRAGAPWHPPFRTATRTLRSVGRRRRGGRVVRRRGARGRGRDRRRSCGSRRAIADAHRPCAPTERPAGEHPCEECHDDHDRRDDEPHVVRRPARCPAIAGVGVSWISHFRSSFQRVRGWPTSCSDAEFRVAATRRAE